MSTRSRRWLLILGGSLVALLVIGFAAFQFAIHALKGQVEKALGPYGEVQAINVGLGGVEIVGIRIRAPLFCEQWVGRDALAEDRSQHSGACRHHSASQDVGFDVHPIAHA